MTVAPPPVHRPQIMGWENNKKDPRGRKIFRILRAGVTQLFCSALEDIPMSRAVMDFWSFLDHDCKGRPAGMHDDWILAARHVCVFLVRLGMADSISTQIIF